MKNNAKYEVCELDRITVTSLPGGQTLAAMGIAFNPRSSRLSVLNVGQSNIYINNGAANANSYVLLPYAANTFRISVRAASLLQFFCPDNNGDMNVQQEGSMI